MTLKHDITDVMYPRYPRDGNIFKLNKAIGLTGCPGTDGKVKSDKERKAERVILKAEAAQRRACNKAREGARCR